MSPVGERPSTVVADADALQFGRLEAPSSSAAKRTELVSSGVPIAQDLRIVDPATFEALPDGTVGEIWLAGRNVGLGYWRREQASAEVFRARLRGDDDRDWLRTGDLGVWHEGALFVTGRIKDMIIVDGRNIYPHDVETCVEQTHP
nr:AMP-binding protein [Micromonospora sp. DSM 115978]